MTYQLNEDLVQLFNTVELNIYDGENFINLMDLFPLMKKGICNVRGAAAIILIYISYSRFHSPINSVVLDKYQEYNNLGLVFEIMFEIREESKKINHIEEMPVISEECTINNLLEFSETIFTTCDFYSTMKKLSKNRYGECIVYSIRTHPKANKLCFNVMLSSFMDIEKLLLTYDPRCNNYKAYILALERGNNNITTMVEDNIITRTLLYLEILRRFIDYEDLVKSIYNLMVKLL